ncbi:MAG: hypothetical protein WAV28_02650 [Sedimentisphaerales bacterium]
MKRKRSARSDLLKKEITKLREIAFGAPENSPFPEATYLEIERESIVRARVLLDCAMVEELTAIIIMDHVLSDSPKWNQIKYFGRIKRYHVLYDDVLGRLPARYKLAVAKKFIRIPKAISKTMQRMLALRDIFAHVRTLDYTKRVGLDYMGKNILSEAGFRSYVEDSRDAVAFLVEKSSALKTPTI